MFREGYYIDIIKTKHCAATVVITVDEKTVQIKKRKFSTNKWLDLEDWTALYDVLEKALAQNDQKSNEKEQKKLTKHLKIAYNFEPSEEPNLRTSLPTIRVRVSPLRRKSKHRSIDVKKNEIITASKPLDKTVAPATEDHTRSENDNLLEEPLDCKVEEYIPNEPNALKIDSSVEERPELKYIPSRKSTLESSHQPTECNEYVPTIVREKVPIEIDYDALYIPNSISKLSDLYETYEPSGSTTPDQVQKYIPNSKGIKKKIEEYQPDFTSKTMKFDDSYVPSSSEKIKELRRTGRKSSSLRKSSKRESDTKAKESSAKRSSSLTPSIIKREM